MGNYLNAISAYTSCLNANDINLNLFTKAVIYKKLGIIAAESAPGCREIILDNLPESERFNDPSKYSEKFLNYFKEALYINNKTNIFCILTQLVLDFKCQDDKSAHRTLFVFRQYLFDLAPYLSLFLRRQVTYQEIKEITDLLGSYYICRPESSSNIIPKKRGWIKRYYSFKSKN